MLSAGITIWLLLNALFVLARFRCAYSGNGRAGAVIYRAGRRTVGHRLSVTNANKTIQAKQFNSHSKSPIKSGQVAK